MPAAGTAAPTFTLDTDEGTALSLGELRGRAVVLYFYPKDDTSGCTIEACEFRDALPRFTGSNTVILGVSPDDVDSHKSFKQKFDLPFTLLADIGHEVAESYGVWKEKSMYGRKFMGVERTTFVIGPDGRIAHVFEKVKPAGHAEEVAAVLATIDSSR